MSLFDEIRSAAPWAKDLSDEELIQKGSELTGLSVRDTAKHLGVDVNDKRNALAAGFSSGIDELQGLAYSGGAALADVTGLDKAKGWLDTQAKRNSVQAELNGRPDLERIEDQTLGSALPYLGYQVAKQVPNLIGGIAAGALVPEVAVPAALSRGAAMLPKFLGGGSLGAAEGFAAKKAALQAGQTFGKQVVGGAAFNEAQAVGSLYQSAVEGGQENPGAKALAGSLPYALTETLPEAMLVGRFVHGGFSGNMLSRAAKGFGTQAATGATSEGLQNEMEMSLNPNLTEAQKVSNRLNSIAAGGLVEGILGGAGSAVSRSTGRTAGSLLTGSDTNNGKDATTSPDNSAIDKAINSNSPEIPMGPPPREALTGPQLPEQAGPPAPSPQQVQAAQQQIAAQKQQEAQEAFNHVTATYGVESLDPETNRFKIGNKPLFGQGQVMSFVTGLDSAFNKLVPEHTEEQKTLFGAAIKSGAVPVANDAKPVTIAKAVTTYLQDWGLNDAANNQEAAQRIDTHIALAEGPKALKDATKLNEMHKAITGVDAPAFVKLQEQIGAEEATKANKTKPTKEGVTNGQLQQQGNPGLREVSVTGGTTETGGEGIGNVRPVSIQPVGTASLGAGSLGLQTGAIPSSGVSTSTAATPSGTTASNAVQGQTEVIEDDRVFAINQIEKMANAAFGTRDAKIIMEFIATDGAVNKAQIADRLGLSRARITQITGAPKEGETFNEQIERMAAEKWGPRLFIEGKRMGYTQGDMLALFETTAKAQDEMAADTGETVNDQESEINAAPPTEEIYNTNADDVNPASSDEANYGTEIGNEELSTSDEDGGQTASGYRIFNPKVSGTSELEDASSKNRAKFSKKDISALSDSQLQNLAADDETTAEKLLQIAEELTKRQEKRVSKGNKNAIQKQSTNAGNVRKPTRSSKEVGETNAKSEEPARTRQTETKTEETKQEVSTALTVAEQAKVEEKSWNDLPVPVGYEQLSPQAKADWAMSVKNGKTNLAAASRVYEENQESIAKQLADESRTIDGTDLITEVGEEKQHLMLTNQVNKLTEAQVSRLEKHYGEERDTPYFMQNLKTDVLRYIEKGAESVAGAIRDVIRQIANGVMAVAVIFNPSFTSQPFKFAVPTYETRTTEVTAQAPAEAAQIMSPAAKRAYEVIYPTIKNELVKNDKLFVVTDKPTATNFIFSPNGKLLFQSKVLVGKAEGNYYKGNNDVVANRITPAGLYNLGIREGGKTAAGYDFNKVFGVEQVENGQKYFITMMHSVWTHESDAAQRLNALKEVGPQNSRYSFGCINVDKETFGKVLAVHEKQMDGAKLFIVPDGNENVMEFINGKAVYSSDMVREKAEPLTKTEKVPKQGTGSTEQTLAAKEEKATEETIAKQAKLTGTASVKLSTKEENPYENPWEAAKLRKNLKETFNSDKEFDDLVTIVETFADIPQEIVSLIAGKENIGRYSVKGLVHEGQVYLISENIAKGEELAVLLHELGAHIGLKKLLGYKNYVGLSEQINLWMQGKGSKLETEIANKVSERLQIWEESVGKEEFAKIGVGAISEETIAYFIEEAVIAGVNPQASRIKGDAQIVQWLRKVLASMKVALRKIGFNKFEDLTAQNIVDLAFGAANQELKGVYHGTDRDFRNFKDSYVTNFLSGWGHYATNLRTEAKGYGKNLVSAMPLADRRDLIQNDRPMADQPRIMKMLNRVINQSTVQAKALRTFLENESVENIDGSDFQQVLGNFEVASQGGLFRMLSKANQDKVVEVGEIVSKFLEQAGILGSTFKPYGRGAPNRQTIMFSARNLGIVSRQRLENTDEDEEFSGFITSPDEYGENIKFSLKKARETASEQVAKLPKPIRGPLQHIFDNVVDFAKKGVPWAAFTEDLADIAAKYIPSAAKYVSLMKERQAIRTKYERNIDLILQPYDKLPSEVKGVGEKSVNRFLKDMTMEGKWAYNPGWIKNFDEAKDIDQVFKDRFEAMPASAQALIKEVFAQGNESLKAMQRAVTENINTEFDALIAAAQKAGEVEEEAELVKKKANSLTEYRTLMRTGSKTPYAPLKRFGNYVVVGRSKEYLAAENTRDDKTSTPDQKAEANKALREMEKNEDHYFVQFAETMGEAKAIAREEKGNYALVEPFEKDSARQALYGGKDVQGLFYRLRHMVEESADNSTADKTERAINRLLSDLHLSLLSNQSARQAERRRRKIAGAEDDMMRAFATQGRANAHFIASLENSESIYDNLRAMKEEADARTPGREDRRRYYNEFMKRHAMGLEYQPSPFIDKALSTTSAWMLLTNPAYYLQNMTQPFMMSLPVIGGKHGYARSWKEMTRAYNDIAGVIKKYGIGEESYSRLPEDVRKVVEELVNRGRIDISLEQDLGRWRSSEDSKFAAFGAATEKLRSIAQNIETLNRVATAVAAYRLDVKTSNPTAALNYADKIIYTTHGDYSGFNAPRVTRSSIGRLATQFRKFQLIQLSLMTRLFHDAFAGESKEVRQIGRRALAYTVGHTAVMGGAMGLPGFAALGMVLSKMFGDDDEPEDIELTMRRAIGNDALADLLVKGVPAMLGVDLSGKLGMGQMLSVLPYTDITLSRKGVYEVAGTLLTGPFGGLMAKAADGASYIGQGDYYKGIEQLLPTGLANVLKGARVASEGVTSRTGDLTMSPDEISFVDGFMVALGLPTKTMTDKAFLQNAKYEFDQFYNDKASEVKREYVRAYRSGDGVALTIAREDWKNLQESRAKNGYTKQPLSTLIKAPMEQTKRERNTIGGVAVNKSNRGFVKQTSEL